MKSLRFKALLSGAMMLTATGVWAVGYPKYPTQSLVEGGQYVLCNLANPTGYMCRTSWDNAMYFLAKSDFASQGVVLTARYDATRSQWYFVTSVTEHEAVAGDPEQGIEPAEAYTEYTYMGIHTGSDNVKARETDICYWTITEGTTAGFYKLVPGEGNNSNTLNIPTHLNASGQYIISSEPISGANWYPDFYGGVKVDENGERVYEYSETLDANLYFMADETSLNWAFVNEADLDRYVFLGNAWNKLKAYEKSYGALEGYAEGFQKTLAAAELVGPAVEGFDEARQTAMEQLLNVKETLYKQLLKARELQQETPQLDAAIAEATTAFNEQTETATVQAAYEKLKKACDDYALGLGDITFMGQNMSFEDLTAQGGNTTTGVAAPPAGWQVRVGGRSITTLDEVKAAGFTAWHGVNADCTGHKEGEMGFGLWNSSVPTYELSQTITGLDNGTYQISCGLMVGANGNGSRRTTQRVFGNLSSTLFASAEEYANDILPGELKTFAGLMEPVTDQEMQELSVKAYVYDGTLTFGVRTDGDIAAALRDARNSGGGDGWFKCDHFTISKLGFDANDQDAVYNHVVNTLNALARQPMDAQCVEKYGALDDSDVDKAIAQGVLLIADAREQVAAYVRLKDKIDEAHERYDLAGEQGYRGLAAFNKVIEEVEASYYDGAYTKEQIDGAIDTLEQAYQDCMKSGADEGADMSNLIINRSFEDLRNQPEGVSGSIAHAPYGWTLTLNGVEVHTPDEIRAQGVTAWCAINNGDGISVDDNSQHYDHQYTDGTHVWGIWNQKLPTVELSQTLTGLQPGTYILSADVMARNSDWSGVNHTTQRIFAQNVVCMYGTEGDYMPAYLKGTSSDDVFQAFNLQEQGLKLDDQEAYEFINYAGWDANNNDILLRRLELRFGVGEDGVAKIGFRTDNINPLLDPETEESVINTNSAAGWFKLDNFQLYFESSRIPTAIRGVEQTILPQQQGIYDLQGRKVNRTQRGIYIIDGKKVVK